MSVLKYIIAINRSKSSKKLKNNYNFKDKFKVHCVRKPKSRRRLLHKVARTTSLREQ